VPSVDDLPATIEVRPQHRFDEAALAAYLSGRLAGAESGLAVRQFQGGQSNPTYLLSCGDGRTYVLRKKPPGQLLPRAHQVEREYRVMAALAGSAVPVPAMRLLVEDEGVIGTAFFVMDFVEGLVLQEPPLELPGPARASLYFEMMDTLAALHGVDWQAVGLADFGRAEGYVPRQIARWSQQYEASRLGAENRDMDWLKDWLAERADIADASAIVHGDFRLGNMIVRAAAPHIRAVLDWELSTIGHPLADLAYCCMPYHLPVGVKGVRGLVGLDLADIGLPGEEDMLARYCAASGREGVPDWSFFVAFSLFRIAAILQGVFARAQQGNASSADAAEVGAHAGMLAAAGRQVAEAAGG